MRLKKGFTLAEILIVLMVIGVIALFINGVTLDIQFSGGTKIAYSYEGEVSVSDIESLASESLKTTCTAQTQTAVDSENSAIHSGF